MEPLADAGGFLLLRANLARSLEGGIPCLDRLRAAARWTKTEPCALPFAENSRRNLRNRTCWPLRLTRTFFFSRRYQKKPSPPSMRRAMTIREGPSYPGPERKPTMEVSLCPYFFFNCLNRQKKLAPWTDNSGNQYEIVQSENNNALSCVRMAPCRPGAFLFSSAFFGPIWPEAWRNTKGRHSLPGAVFSRFPTGQKGNGPPCHFV